MKLRSAPDLAHFLPVFLREVVLNHRQTGAILPSSPYLAQCITESSSLAGARTILEIGPGTGVFTEEILRRADPGSRVLVVEKNARFAALLRERFPRLEIIEGCATLLPQHLGARGLETVDRIISGLPWAAMRPLLQARLLRAIRLSLAADGLFTTFAYFGPHWLPSGRAFRKRLHRFFSQVGRTPLELRNLPPAFVYWAKKS